MKEKFMYLPWSQDLPACMALANDYIWTLDFNEDPNYQLLRSLFENIDKV
jgi:hypothetical protein